MDEYGFPVWMPAAGGFLGPPPAGAFGGQRQVIPGRGFATPNYAPGVTVIPPGGGYAPPMAYPVASPSPGLASGIGGQLGGMMGDIIGLVLQIFMLKVVMSLLGGLLGGGALGLGGGLGSSDTSSSSNGGIGAYLASRAARTLQSDLADLETSDVDFTDAEEVADWGAGLVRAVDDYADEQETSALLAAMSSGNQQLGLLVALGR